VQVRLSVVEGFVRASPSIAKLVAVGGVLRQIKALYGGGYVLPDAGAVARHEAQVLAVRQVARQRRVSQRRGTLGDELRVEPTDPRPHRAASLSLSSTPPATAASSPPSASSSSSSSSSAARPAPLRHANSYVVVVNRFHFCVVTCLRQSYHTM
jgi:hypothetical protein